MSILRKLFVAICFVLLATTANAQSRSWGGAVITNNPTATSQVPVTTDSNGHVSWQAGSAIAVPLNSLPSQTGDYQTGTHSINGILNQAINPTAYGVVGNGSTDDTVNFQSAATACGAGASPNFRHTLDIRTILTMKLTATVAIPANCNVIGPSRGSPTVITFAGASSATSALTFAGNNIVSGIKVTLGTNALASSVGIVSTVSGASNVVFDSDVIDGNIAGQAETHLSGILVNGGANNAIRNSEIRFISGNGIRAVDSSNIYIDHNYIHDIVTTNSTNEAAIDVVSSTVPVSNIFVSYNRADDSAQTNGAEGIKIAQGTGQALTNVNVTNNIVSPGQGGVSVWGIEIFASNATYGSTMGISVAYNQVSCTQGATNLDGISIGLNNVHGNGSVDDNTIRNCGGISLEGIADQTRYVDNTIIASGGSTINSTAWTGPYTGVYWDNTVLDSVALNTNGDLQIIDSTAGPLHAVVKGLFERPAFMAIRVNTSNPSSFTDIRGARIIMGTLYTSANIAITSGTAALTDTDAPFTASMVNRGICLPEAGASGGKLCTTISAFTDASHVTLAANASTTLPSAAAPIPRMIISSGASADAIQLASQASFGTIEDAEIDDDVWSETIPRSSHFRAFNNIFQNVNVTYGPISNSQGSFPLTATQDGRIWSNQASGTGGLETVGNGLKTSPIGTPAAPVVTCVGTCAGGAVSYFLVYRDAAGRQTLPSVAGTVNPSPTVYDANDYVKVSPTGLQGAFSYDVLIGDTAHSVATNIPFSQYVFYLDKVGGTGSAYTTPTRDATGDSTLNGQLAMSSNKATGLAAGTTSGDALAFGLNHLNDMATATGAYSMGSNKLTGLAAPAATNDALSEGNPIGNTTRSSVKATTVDGTGDFTTTGHIGGTGTAPTVTACGTGPTVVAGSTDTSGTVNPGTGAPTSCTITFHTAYTNVPGCAVSDNGANTLGVSISTTGLVVSGAAAITAVHYVCLGH